MDQPDLKCRYNNYHVIGLKQSTNFSGPHFFILNKADIYISRLLKELKKGERDEKVFQVVIWTRLVPDRETCSVAL